MVFSSARKEQHIRINPLAPSQPNNPMDGLTLWGVYLRFAVPKYQFNSQIFAPGLFTKPLTLGQHNICRSGSNDFLSLGSEGCEAL